MLTRAKWAKRPEWPEWSKRTTVTTRPKWAKRTTGTTRLDSTNDSMPLLASAELYPLLCAVAHLTGDLSLLREDLALDQSQLLVPEHGLTPEQDAEARRLAGEALRAHIGTASGSSTFPAPTTARALSPEDRRRIFDFLVGRASTPAWEAFLTEEPVLRGPTRALRRGMSPREVTRSAVPSWAPVPPGSRRRTGCARPGWT